MTEQSTATDQKTATTQTQSNGFNAESFDEKEFKQQLSKDTFQKELDQAITELRLGDVISDFYEFDADSYDHTIEVHGVEYKHRFKNPTDEDEQRKEAMSVIIRRNAGKFQGDDMIESFSDPNPALKRYYDGTAFAVWGYPIDENDDGEQWLPLQTVVVKADEVSQDDRKTFKLGEGKDLTLLQMIPDSDKIKAAQLLHGGGCYVIHEKGKRIRSVRAKREYIVKQLFGVKRQEDGTLSKPTRVVAYHFKEAGAQAIGKFDTQAQPSKTLIKNEGQPEERRTISISTCKSLFEDHITRIQGAKINNEEVGAIQSGDPRLKRIPGACQRDAVFVYLNFLKS